MRAVLFAASLSFAASLFAATPRPNLTGVVLDSTGAPVPGVTVLVYHAGVKVGYSTFCPSCYVDCGKRTVTDARGAFKIRDLSPDLWFTLLAAGDRYVPAMTKPIDPATVRSVTLTLSAKPPISDFRGTVRGRVVGADGSPVQDAIINPTGLITGEGSSYGALAGLQPISVSNKQGEFEVTYSKPTPKMLLEVEARGLAPRFAVLETGPDRHSVTLADGATIAGRLLRNGQPLPNAQIGLIAKDRGGFGVDLKLTGNPYEVVRIGTDSKGRFVIPNVPVPVNWYVYPTMESISTIGAAGPVEIHASKNGQYIQTPDLVIGRGFHVRGIIIASNNKPIAEGMHVIVSSETVWDAQILTLAPNGRFEFSNLPAGKYTVSAAVKGYHEKMPEHGPTPFLVDHDIDNFTTTIYPDVP